MLNAASRVLRRTDGQDLLEYGLLMSLIAVAAIFSVTTLGNTVNSVLWQVIAQNFPNPVAAALVVAASSAAAVVDLRTRRVPNVLTAGIAAGGLALAALDLTRLSLSAAAAGLVVGLLLMLPGHLLGGTGAGDVKLLAALGTLLGPAATASAFLYTLMAGGLIVVIVAVGRGRLKRTVARTAALVGTGGGNVAEESNDLPQTTDSHMPRPLGLARAWLCLECDVRRLPRTRGRCARPLTGERGAALLETAIALPLVLLVAVGIFEFGRAFQTWQVLTNAAREGARVAVLPNPVAGSVEARVREYMTSGQLSNAATATVTVDRNASISIGGTNASASSVTVQYPFSFMVLNPVARLVVGSSTLGAAPITMMTSAQMRNEAQ